MRFVQLYFHSIFFPCGHAGHPSQCFYVPQVGPAAQFLEEPGCFSLRKRKVKEHYSLQHNNQQMIKCCTNCVFFIRARQITFCWYDIYISGAFYCSQEWKQWTHWALSTSCLWGPKRFSWRKGHCHIWHWSSTTRHTLQPLCSKTMRWLYSTTGN